MPRSWKRGSEPPQVEVPDRSLSRWAIELTTTVVDAVRCRGMLVHPVRTSLSDHRCEVVSQNDGVAIPQQAGEIGKRLRVFLVVPNRVVRSVQRVTAEREQPSVGVSMTLVVPVEESSQLVQR